MGSATSCVAQSSTEAPSQRQSLYDWTTVCIMGGSDLRSFLLSNYDDINWSDLSQNRHGLAMIILEENYEHIDWTQLSRNSSYGAVRILRKNQHKIVWRELSMNKSSGVEKMLRENPDKISWDMVCLNPSRWAMKLLLENPNHINMTIIKDNGSNAAFEFYERLNNLAISDYQETDEDSYDSDKLMV